MENFIELKGQYNKDCKVYNTQIEDEEMSLLFSILDKKEFERSKIRIMPDHHLGKGVLIGFTAPITDAICPSFVGVDIGCTITTCMTDAKINKENIPLIEYRIKKDVPMGFNIHKNRIYDIKDFFKFLKKEYNKSRSTWPEMINDFDINEKEISKLLKRINMDEGVFYKSIGTLGGGNHFIEIGNYNDNYAFTVHCGSRNFGNKVCKYWEKIAASSQVDNKLLKEEMIKLKNNTKDKTQLPKLITQLIEDFKSRTCSNGYICGDNMKAYLTDMVIAQAYAKYNHKIICEIIEKIIKKITNGKVVETIQSTHNYVDMQDHIIRKGAIRAYKDEKMIVPFNMRDGLAICIGKSNDEWNCSCSHGAGRKLSRAKAKQQLSMDEFNETMKDVYSTSVCRNTLDESPMAYKDTETILNLIQETAEIVYIVKPIINIKATESEQE
ncbi:MAG: RtcB family protein [Bacilli bacterium]|nr:RtcB family protein [Bacilli bacterium]